LKDEGLWGYGVKGWDSSGATLTLIHLDCKQA
jgi:hypothetical protein